VNSSFAPSVRIPFLFNIEGPDEDNVCRFLEQTYEISSRDPLGYRTFRIRSDPSRDIEMIFPLFVASILAYVERFDAKATIIDTRPS